MSYARNLARLSRSGVVAVNSVQDVRDITIYDGLYPQAVSAKYGVTEGDGGGGYYDVFSGAAPGTYVDDGEDILVFTGGDGSAGAVRHVVYAQNVPLLALTVSDPPTQAETQAVADKVDELIGSLKTAGIMK